MEYLSYKFTKENLCLKESKKCSIRKHRYVFYGTFFFNLILKTPEALRVKIKI